MKHGYSVDQLKIYIDRDDFSIDQIYEVVKHKEEHPEIYAPDFFGGSDGKKFLFNVMGDYLIEQLHVCRINGALHVYDNGVYRPGEDLIHGYMLKLVPDLSDARRREVYRYIKVNLDTPTKKVSPPHLIPLKSKIYDISTDKFYDYSPDHVFLNRFPYDYDPKAAPVDLVDDTLLAIADNDTKVIDLILESFGNCFFLLNAFRGTVFFYGQCGNNGKSTLLNMLLQLVGRENSSF